MLNNTIHNSNSQNNNEIDKIKNALNAYKDFNDSQKKVSFGPK